MHGLFVDTSGWIEIFGKAEPRHDEATGILIGALRKSQLIITTSYVIAEFVGLGEKKCRLSREDLLKAVDEITEEIETEIVHISEESYTAAMAYLRRRLDKEWSLVDAMSFIIMEQRGIGEALTTDHHFVQAGFKRLLSP